MLLIIITRNILERRRGDGRDSRCTFFSRLNHLIIIWHIYWYQRHLVTRMKFLAQVNSIQKKSPAVPLRYSSVFFLFKEKQISLSINILHVQLSSSSLATFSFFFLRTANNMMRNNMRTFYYLEMKVFYMLTFTFRVN